MAEADAHPLVVAETLALVGIGGFAGSNLRYFIAEVLPGLAGTLVPNVVGSLVLGFLLYEAIGSDLLAGRTRIVAGTGFLSSFTTYSTFAVESLTARPFVLVAYVLGSYVLGFAAILVGRSLANRIEAGHVEGDDRPEDTTAGGDSRGD